MAELAIESFYPADERTAAAMRTFATTPFHPTAARELAIALADERALQQAETSPGATASQATPLSSP